MPGGSCVFNPLWLSKPEYTEWLSEEKGNKSACFCRVCKKIIDVRVMGESAIVSHAKGKKHKERVEASKPAVPLTSFFSTSRITVTTSNQQPQSAVPAASSSTVSSFCTKSDVLKAEIIHSLKVVDDHQSFKSCENNAYALMFPDSDIAKSFRCGESKTKYITVFGIAPYFMDQLKNRVKNKEAYVLLFDESLNKELKQKQLDIHVRYWNGDEVATEYLTSTFLGHAYASVICESLSPTITDLGYRKLVQISMDGPNVNWKVFKDIQADVEKQTSMKMLQIGSCGIHILHNSFRAGCAATQWDIEDILSKLYTLFLDCPARREDFIAHTGSSIFPLKFCSHRWLENIKPAERAVEIIPNVVAYCTAAKSRVVTEPSNKSFQVVQKAIQNPLLTAKLKFFIIVAKEVEPFLARYQTDRPMLPFISGDLYSLLKGLLERILSPGVLKKEGATLSGLVNIDLRKTENYLPLEKVSVGFACEKQLVKTGLASEKQRRQFRSDCKDFLKAMVKKIMEKSPATFPLVRMLDCLDPRRITQENKVSANIKRFTGCLNILCEANRIKEDDVDQIQGQYKRFLEDMQDESAFKTFTPEDGRLDHLYSKHLKEKKDYQELWATVRQLLLMSHGQATVERGFSINKEASCDNLSQLSLVARRQVLNYVRKVGGVDKVEITKELLLSASSARNKYHEYLEQQQKEKEQTRAALKRKAQEDTVADLKEKKRRCEKDIQHLTQEADRLAEQAELNGALTLLTQSNALRSKCKGKKAEVKTLSSQIDEELGKLK